MADKQLMAYAVGEQMNLMALLKNVSVRVAKNGKQYLDLTFEDQSGEITGKFWDASTADIERYQAGRVVRLAGKRENYQGSPQVKIGSLRLANADEPHDPSDFVVHAPMKASEMEDELNQVVFEITNQVWNRIVRFLIAKHRDAFFTYPAAKRNHHAFQGGLAYHTLSILRLAHSVVKQYPTLDAPLLYAGAILHDLGKVIELSGPVSTQYTVEGNLLGHISIVDGEIVSACNELKFDLNNENVVLLRHMILAHHGLLEYGSPVRPRLLEAEVLHQLDELDASIMMMTNAIEHTAPGEFGERLFAMDGRSFYRPNEPQIGEQDNQE
ncbi:3'-5' exoribonuclease YhaM family protein [Secundilactobacillus mixtipabuli]|uniref:3'-5' exonuclease n=1 Tax=Secundilactobacillus mixtipabuli TaxID=1435342 RepID=A0A1Z5IA37_9LACO|nr:HD domain-containing protein [Secundilactobacillus mixtipabuli]GAW98410.1 3'-5' exonuclease [Secundilactobacillus mixtipabuli]